MLQQLMTLMSSTGYASAAAREPNEMALHAQRSFDSEEDFLQEHKMLLWRVRQLVPAANISTRYYPAGESLPKYTAAS